MLSRFSFVFVAVSAATLIGYHIFRCLSTTFLTFFEEVFSLFSILFFYLGCLSRNVDHLTTSISICQHLFSTFFDASFCTFRHGFEQKRIPLGKVSFSAFLYTFLYSLQAVLTQYHIHCFTLFLFHTFNKRTDSRAYRSGSWLLP